VSNTKNYRICFRLEENEYAILRHYAEQQRISKSKTVRRFIAEALGFRQSRDLGWMAERQLRHGQTTW
jgi:hypothetical protein